MDWSSILGSVVSGASDVAGDYLKGQSAEDVERLQQKAETSRSKTMWTYVIAGLLVVVGGVAIWLALRKKKS